jgi:hypothetical protein
MGDTTFRSCWRLRINPASVTAFHFEEDNITPGNSEHKNQHTKMRRPPRIGFGRSHEAICVGRRRKPPLSLTPFFITEVKRKDGE